MMRLNIGLTPLQNRQTAGLLDISFMDQNWFIPFLMAVLTILAGLFILVTFIRSLKERKDASRLFLEFAKQKGLNSHQRKILLGLAKSEKLKRSESIFTTPNAFDRASTKAVRVALVSQGPDKSRHLRSELSKLRDKLGFHKANSAVRSSAKIIDNKTTRNIPVGKKLYITIPQQTDITDAESIVRKSDELELVVETNGTLKIEQGQTLCIRYYFDASVREFDSTVVDYFGNMIVLSHSNRIRLVNRRRFLRVSVDEPALIAAFPFAQKLTEDDSYRSKKTADDMLRPPEYIPANVTELAGPGLRIKSKLDVKVGDRVAVILKVSDRKSGSHEMVGDIGFVRHTEAVQDAFSIAVELTGLNESNLSRMVRATNIASIKSGVRNIRPSVQKERDADEIFSEKVIA